MLPIYARWPWGDNWEGQLGTGTVSGRRSPYIRDRTISWTPRSKGRWTVALGYTYTDPGHRDVADRIAVIDAYEDAAIVVDSQPPKPAEEQKTHTARSRKYIEAVSTLHYPATAEVGEQTFLTLDQARFGQTVDDDFAEEVHLILTNEDTEQVVRLFCFDSVATSAARLPRQRALPRITHLYQSIGGTGHEKGLQGKNIGCYQQCSTKEPEG